MMQEEFTLDLSGVGVRTGESYFRPGYHIVVIEDAKIHTNNNSGVVSVKVTFTSAEGGSWKFNEFCTIKHPGLGSTKEEERKKAKTSIEVGLSYLKSILTFGGADNPDQFSPSKLKGLKLGAVLVRDSSWVDNDGQTRRGGPKLAQIGRPFMTVQELDEARSTNQPHPALEEQAKKDAMEEQARSMGGHTTTTTTGHSPASGFVPPAPPASGRAPF